MSSESMEELKDKDFTHFKEEKKRLIEDNAFLARKCTRLSLEAELNKEAIEKAKNTICMTNLAEALAVKLEHQITVNERIKNKIVNAILDIEDFQAIIEKDTLFIDRSSHALISKVETYSRLETIEKQINTDTGMNCAHKSDKRRLDLTDHIKELNDDVTHNNGYYLDFIKGVANKLNNELS